FWRVRSGSGQAQEAIGEWRVMAAVGRNLAWLIIIGALTGSPVQAEDLDHDKSASKLFADTCASCHRSARGLAKGRFSLTLWFFLKQHYTSSSASAQALTAYLQSVDAPRPNRVSAAARRPGPKSAARRRQAAATGNKTAGPSAGGPPAAMGRPAAPAGSGAHALGMS